MKKVPFKIVSSTVENIQTQVIFYPHVQVFVKRIFDYNVWLAFSRDEEKWYPVNNDTMSAQNCDRVLKKCGE